MNKLHDSTTDEEDLTRVGPLDVAGGHGDLPRSGPEVIPTPKERPRRDAFIAGLRALADFLDQHPTVQAPFATMNSFVRTREDLAAHARIGGWEKVYNDDYFWLSKTFGPDLSLDITAPRETVCRKVVKGVRMVEAQPAHEVEDVEWVCDDVSLLAGHS